ncbi:MAG: signal peptidase II [Alphaproteobacteria bacterium]
MMKSRPYQFWGTLIAVTGLLADQALKMWLLGPFELASKGQVAVLPFFDLILVWNKGVSYGLFPQGGNIGRYALIVVGLGGAILFAVWMWRAGRLLVALSLGLIAGGALANAIDRIRFGAVVDFALLHAGSFEWYVFNLADVWIVAGVIGLLIGWNSDRSRPEKATDG